jgi:hypothetical protein
MKRAIANGDIILLRRGVYSFGKRFQRQPLNLFELAQKIYVPSYISLESALSFHGWIPEATYTVTSVCMKRSHSFETDVGLFSYTRSPKFNFIGVDRLFDKGAFILMANPTKSILDYIYVHKIEVDDPLAFFDSLRIEADSYLRLSYELLSEISESYASIRISKFIKKMRRIL